MRLNTKPNLSDPDLFYTSLTDVHRQLNREQSESVNARLVLLLANHIGLMEVLKEALTIAKDIE
jgi:hypothetical protein